MNDVGMTKDNDHSSGADRQDDALRVRAYVAREPVHPSITPSQIDQLVERFYADVWADQRLGPMFAARIDDRPGHLSKMKRFWSSVLLKTGAYHGRPIPAHMPLAAAVKDPDFVQWLALFERACLRAFAPEAVPIVMEITTRIAQTIWSAMTLKTPRPFPF